MRKQIIQDLDYDVSAQDWKITAGDLAPFVASHEALFTALLIDAFESQTNSMKFILRNWGFEGRGDDYTATDNETYQELYLYIAEILNALSFLYTTITDMDPTFPGTNTFSIRIQAVLSDVGATAYDHTLTWNGATNRATVV